MATLATVAHEDGVVTSSADVNGFTIKEMQFPADYVQAEFEPELPYLALVLEGVVEKSFASSGGSIQLGPSLAVTMPAGARHCARFGRTGARILIVKPSDTSRCTDAFVNRLTNVREPGLYWLARRLAGELRASDAAAPLAAEGFALELLAGINREATPSRDLARPPAWLRSVEELLRSRIADRLGLDELADEIGVHATHLARVFRAHHGVSVGEYRRRLRVAWAAAEIPRSETPLAVIARQAGFSDQSHFTRLFKQYVGVTPARYRRETTRGSAWPSA